MLVRRTLALLLTLGLSLAIDASPAFAGSVTRDGITVTTPNAYGSCPTAVATDRITSAGLNSLGSPQQLNGWVNVQYVIKDGRSTVPGGYYTVASNTDVNLAVSYPPISQWLSGEIHVDVSLQLLQGGLYVYDADGQVVFGPGQDWDVYCPGLPSPKTGCTFTIGAWKNHLTVSNGGLPVVLGTGNGKSFIVSTQQQVSDFLSQNVYGSNSNGITKLYAQLLAAQLDIGSGANGTAVTDTISAVNAFLEQYNWQDWNKLSSAQQQQVVSWQTTLENYDAGKIGPGKCPS